MLPKYEMVASDVEHRLIRTRSAHDPLPSERELMETYRVSRMTIRAAIDKLVDAGKVYRVHGRGTYVGSPALLSKTPRLTSFSQDMVARGHKPSSVVLTIQCGPASSTARERLHLVDPEETVMIRRLRLADGQPMALEQVEVPVAFLDLKRLHLESGSLYEHLSDRGKEPYRAEEVISACELSARDATLLGVRRSAAALFVERVASTRHGELVEFARTWYRADRYTFELVVSLD